jgi:hypothetical protein
LHAAYLPSRRFCYSLSRIFHDRRYVFEKGNTSKNKTVAMYFWPANQDSVRRFAKHRTEQSFKAVSTPAAHPVGPFIPDFTASLWLANDRARSFPVPS